MIYFSATQAQLRLFTDDTNVFVTEKLKNVKTLAKQSLVHTKQKGVNKKPKLFFSFCPVYKTSSDWLINQIALVFQTALSLWQIKKTKKLKFINLLIRTNDL